MASIRKRNWINKDGKRTFCWMVDFIDNEGNRESKSGFKTKVEAEAYRAKIEHSLNTGSYIKDNKILFESAMAIFIESHINHYCKFSTADTYKSVINQHILPFFKGKKLNDIKPTTIHSFITDRKDHEASISRINEILKVLKVFFNKLEELEMIQNNPARCIKKLKEVKKEMKILSKEQINILLESSKNTNQQAYTLISTAIFTGIRQGELLALTWEDVDFTNNIININKTVYDGIVTTTKTESSVRKITMCKGLKKVLQEWKLRTSNDNLVFPNKKGNHIDKKNLTARIFKPILKNAELPNIRWHDLRHTYASIMISERASMRVVQEQLGHKSFKTTMDTYTHTLASDAEKYIEILDGIITKEDEKILEAV
ncbi:MAG: site-specific integrase [bacterium]